MVILTPVLISFYNFRFCRGPLRGPLRGTTTSRPLRLNLVVLLYYFVKLKATFAFVLIFVLFSVFLEGTLGSPIGFMMVAT